MKAITKKILSIVILVSLGVGGRVFFVNYIGIPNFEIVSSFALLSGFYLGGIFSFVVPLAIIFLSDLFIGNNAILIFTWSAFGIIGLMGMAIKKEGFKKTVLQAPIFGIVASCFFFIYTNFGWWVLSGMYSHNLQGLLACYVNALPFFKTNLLGNLILAPFVFSAFFILKSLNLQVLKKYDFIRQRH
ncbi:MAG: DUF6580 family putative transport protein [Patescibacteria group bacterium]